MKYNFTLNDGTTYTAFNNTDMYELIKKYMGEDVSSYFEELTTQLKEEADFTNHKIKCDLECHESSLDSNREAFQEINDECKKLVSEYQRETGRNRLNALRPWNESIEMILRIVSNQI